MYKGDFGNYECIQCIGGYPNGSTCTSEPLVINCAEGKYDPQWGKYCGKCNPGYMVKNQVCVIQNIAGCLQVFQDIRGIYVCQFCDASQGWYAIDGTAGNC